MPHDLNIHTYSLEELALGSAGVTHNANIDVTTETCAFCCCLGNTTKQHKQHTSLYLITAYIEHSCMVYVQYTGVLYKNYTDRV